MCRWQLGLELKQSYSQRLKCWNQMWTSVSSIQVWLFSKQPFMKYSYTFILVEKSKIHFGSSLESTKLELVFKQTQTERRFYKWEKVWVGWGDFSSSMFSRIQGAGQALESRHNHCRQQPFLLIRDCALLLLLSNIQHILHASHLLSLALLCLQC